MYNRFSEGETPVKIWIVALALCSFTGLVMADELEDSYTKLKDAVAKKDPDAVKAAAAETLKLARATETAAKPTDADEAANWKQRVEYGKEVEGYTEYALAFVAAQGIDPAKTIDLVDILIAQNPKSTYLDLCTGAYAVALGKSDGTAKQKQAAQMAGMSKILKGRPDNIVALQALVDGGSSQYAEKLIAAAKAKSKPEGVSEADWEKQRNAALAAGYFTAGYVQMQKQFWTDCDKNMKAAMPLLAGDPGRLSTAYFALGMCNFNFGKMTNDRPRMQAGEKYEEQAAAMKGPMQDQAYHNVAAMKQALAGK
jgi:hypothetical protein